MQELRRAGFEDEILNEERAGFEDEILVRVRRYH